MKTITTINYLEKLRKLVLNFLENNDAKIILFGSRARKNNRDNSDVDIGIIPKQNNSINNKITLLKEAIEQSNIPYKVDVVNFAETSVEFQEIALKEAVIWKK